MPYYQGYVIPPERWLSGQGADGKGIVNVELQRYLTPFAKWTRVCVGLNLAWAELYLIVAALLRRYELEMQGTARERDVDVVRDYRAGLLSAKSRGLEVKLELRNEQGVTLILVVFQKGEIRSHYRVGAVSRYRILKTFFSCVNSVDYINCLNRRT